MNKRLFEFAKELNLPSKEVLERCKKLGFAIPSQLTVVDEKIQAEVRKDLGLADLVSVAASVAAAAPPASPAGTKTSSSSPLPTRASATATATFPAPRPTAPRPA